MFTSDPCPQVDRITITTFGKWCSQSSYARVSYRERESVGLIVPTWALSCTEGVKLLELAQLEADLKRAWPAPRRPSSDGTDDIILYGCCRLTFFPLTNHVRLAGGLEGGEVQLPLRMSPTAYRCFSITIFGSPSGKSATKYPISSC